MNKSQSTNDVFPTAMHIAIALKAMKTFTFVKITRKGINEKTKEFKNIVKVKGLFARCKSNNIRQEFSGYHSQLKKCISRMKMHLKKFIIWHKVNCCWHRSKYEKNFDKNHKRNK